MLRFIISLVIVFILLVSSFFPLSIASYDENLSGPMDSPWPMKCHDAHHTSQSQYSTTDNDGALIWKFKTDGWISAGIVIDKEGVLYFGDGCWYLYAVYRNGSLKWKYKTNGDIYCTPALAEDGTIYFTSVGGYLSALNPDGTLKWKFGADDPMFCSPVIAEDGTIYFGNHGIHAINPDGTEKWNYPTAWIYSDPAIGEDGTVYIGSIDGYLYAMYPNGTLRWQFKTGDEIHSHPSIGSDGTIYFGSNDKYIYALYPDGTLRWRYKINGQLYSSVAVGKDGTIYAPDHDLYAFYPDGALKWRFDFGEALVASSSPAISSEGTIYIGVTKQGVSGGYIVSIDHEGTEKWRRKIANFYAESSPSIGADGTVYIGSAFAGPPHDPEYGYVYSLGPGNTPPDTPTIDGVASGIPRKEYTFSFTINDFDGDDMYLFVDWGDDTNDTWVGPYTSGKIELNHTWSKLGIYPIKAKVKDEYGAESKWATTRINMPKNKAINIAFYRFLENHPYMFPLLRKIFD